MSDTHVQRNARGEPVLPNPLRDMVHTMAALELHHREHPSPYYPAFSADACAASGELDYEVAEALFAELLAAGHIEDDPQFEPGAYRTTEKGRAWLDEQLALVGIPPFNSSAYKEAGNALRPERGEGNDGR